MGPSGTSALVSYTITRLGLLKAGASYTLVLDITPNDKASNQKPAQVKLTVKVMA